MKLFEPPVHLGRPRTFCVEAALNKAMHVFWQKGYEGTSLSDLTATMGINRPSLYAAYGNKEALFRKVLDRYIEQAGALLRESLDLPTARAAIEHLLLAAAEDVTQPHNPHGCFTVRCALSSGKAADSVRLELTKRRADGETMVRERLERAQAEGDLPAGADAADLARYVMTVLQGMSVQAAGGANREQLQRVAQTALRAWPR